MMQLLMDWPEDRTSSSSEILAEKHNHQYLWVFVWRGVSAIAEWTVSQMDYSDVL